MLRSGKASANHGSSFWSHMAYSLNLPTIWPERTALTSLGRQITVTKNNHIFIHYTLKELKTSTEEIQHTQSYLISLQCAEAVEVNDI